MLERANFQIAKQNLEDEQNSCIDYNRERVETIHESVKSAYIVGSLGRILMVLISIKVPMICKFYIYYEAMMTLLDFCLVRTNAQAQHHVTLLVCALNFVSYYFNLSTGLMTMIVV